MQIYNYTDKPVSDIIGMHSLVVPPNGSLETSERKGEEMLRRHPEALGYAPRIYTEADRQVVLKMSEAELRTALLGLMDGHRVVFRAAAGAAGQQSGKQPELDQKAGQAGVGQAARK
jgi:hypothetical protein